MKITNNSYFPFDQQVPIYNWFYPLCYDENLSDFTSSNTIARNIKPGQIRTRSLYFHVPFCDTICSFCPFVRGKFQDRAIVEKYTQALVKEVSIKGLNPAYSEVPVNAIFFGGGTPSILNAEQIQRIGKAIADHFDLSQLKEFSFEMEVKSVTDEKLEALKRIGVTHARFGLQTFNQRYRNHFNLTASIDQCVTQLLAMQRYFSHVSFDLLYGMNGQSFDELAADVLSACATGASNIDIYPVNNLSTQLKLHNAYGDAGLEPLSAMTKTAMRSFIDEIMRSKEYTPHNGHGYIRNDMIANSNVIVTREYQFQYHKSVYGYADSDTLGFGVSAMTSTHDVGYENHGNRNVYIDTLLKEGDVPCRYRSFSPVEAATKPLIMHLAYFGFLDKSKISWDLVHCETLASLEKLIDTKLVEDKGEAYELTKNGWLWYTNIMFFLHPEPDKKVLCDSFERREQQPGRLDGVRHFLLPEKPLAFA
ncbi:radical SAM protein [Brucella sp. NBRC 12950]|uniref:radical SAM protein n=1 Tax=Brucella sp. NBRC 12950 TaxID=2994518 RepID=UPI0024A53CCE|nr:radical SAM protein [Brucella sp. NBRC 12950]GLU27921.1 putative heme utilization radical SAM enzyme HutW [Brucella sp. NBRC 12950]